MKAYRTSYDKSRVSLTLDNAELSIFSGIAKGESIGVATAIKQMALAYHQNENLMSAKLEQELKELNFLVRNIANNINQIAYKSNLGSHVDVNEVLNYLRSLSERVTQHTQTSLKRGNDH